MAEKRPTEYSLDFMVNQIVDGQAKTIKFLRGDWKVAERKYNEVKGDLAKAR